MRRVSVGRRLALLSLESAGRVLCKQRTVECRSRRSHRASPPRWLRRTTTGTGAGGACERMAAGPASRGPRDGVNPKKPDLRAATEVISGGKLSSSTLGMRFMQRKAEKELAAQLASRGIVATAAATALSEGWSIGVLAPAASQRGPLVVQEQRRHAACAVPTSGSTFRRAFGGFNSVAGQGASAGDAELGEDDEEDNVVVPASKKQKHKHKHASNKSQEDASYAVGAP